MVNQIIKSAHRCMDFPGDGAVISDCGQYRYLLKRFELMRADMPPIAFCLLNPSTADAMQDDPTIRRLKDFSHSWGYGDLYVVNLFALRATKPKDMKDHDRPIGEANDAVLIEIADFIDEAGGVLVYGWGANGGHLGRSHEVMSLLGNRKRYSFPLTTTGQPGHPLYLPKKTKLLPIVELR